MKSEDWKTYRTRFLVRAKQLSSTLSFVDSLGRQHSGRKGDYLVESSDGVVSIAPRQIFEDIYVPMPLLGEPGTGDILIGKSTIDERTRARDASSPTLNRLTFGPLEIETVKLGKRSISRRKLPQPCRDRRGSTARLSLM